MRERGIRLSPKHGINPAVPLCYFCQEPKQEIILAGRLRGDAEAPKAAVWDDQPCGTCREHMRQGVVLISVRDGEFGPNPHRTGGWVVVKDEAIQRWFVDASRVLVKRAAFVDDQVWDKLGLPRAQGNTDSA